MSQENVTLFREAIDAFNRRDRAAWVALCDPEYENVPPRDWPESASIRGPEAIWDFFVAAQEPWEEGTFGFGELIDAGNDKVVAEQRAEMRGKASGADVAWSYWHVITFRDGKAMRSEWFIDRAEAFEAAGLDE
jgi:ketosteroid isomerase-like protein